jgi:hypothetical protein
VRLPSLECDLYALKRFLVTNCRGVWQLLVGKQASRKRQAISGMGKTSA